MNVFIALLYGMTIWLSVMAYCIIVDAPLLRVVLLGPVIVSGFVAFLMSLDYAIDGVIRTLRRRYGKAAN